MLRGGDAGRSFYFGRGPRWNAETVHFDSLENFSSITDAIAENPLFYE